MNRGETTQGLGNPGENADSYFHPLLGSFSPAQTGQATEIQGKSSLSTKKWQSHLANPGSPASGATVSPNHSPGRVKGVTGAE